MTNICVNVMEIVGRKCSNSQSKRLQFEKVISDVKVKTLGKSIRIMLEMTHFLAYHFSEIFKNINKYSF